MSHREARNAGFIGALRRLRDPLLLLVVPVVFAVLTIAWGWLPAWGIGFDFVGTMWEPARAILEGNSPYPEPVRASIVIGNPSVYPPPAIVASIPLAVLPEAVAGWLWFLLQAASVLSALWILGVRDWRCHVVAVTSPVVVQGLVFGNLTVLLVLAAAVAWRYRGKASVVGITLGAAVAAKFVVWPLVVWLLLTKRYGAAAWGLCSTLLLVFGVWGLLGFEGLTDYPALLRELQDVYAIRSISLATIAGGLGASLSMAVAVSWAAGLVLIALAAWLARGVDGDRRAFTVAILACVIASPIVWPYYPALLFVPIAIAWPRFSPAWLFGYAVWLVGAFTPKSVVDVCCRPEGVVEAAWNWSHADPSPWFALGVTLVVLIVAAWCTWTGGRVMAGVRSRAS